VVSVQIVRDHLSIRELACSGHAGFDDGNGFDLVCAAVSALTGALGIGFTQILPGCADVECGDGWFALRVKAHLSEVALGQTEVLLQSIALALTEMGQHYPGFIECSDSRIAS
jgi:uncharacterized protein YsxB (DUF464 family)